jgi:hypothetical protein
MIHTYDEEKKTFASFAFVGTRKDKVRLLFLIVIICYYYHHLVILNILLHVILLL